ncbi:MAG: hypothetical protein IIB00_09945 [candidate division Zixibacteria bacterium]|nr:hypothetical protein [candidate division Zixibacteria bacterium]
MTHISGPDTLPAWSNVFIPAGVQIVKSSYNGNLPDSFCVLAGSISALSPSGLVDAFELSLSLPNSGIFCIDTTFIPPSCQWIFAGSGTVSPTWGGISGYPTDGYCVTVASALCDYHKPGYRDYAIYGMPDFDQKIDQPIPWVDFLGRYSYCGPVAMANCLWWFDSKFEPLPMDPRPFYPDTLLSWSDGYPLIQSNFIPDWDDHDTTMPEDIINDLAACMGTDQAGAGTSINNMQSCLNNWLINAGVRADYVDTLVQYPNYTDIRARVLASCNVILALAFYEDIGGNSCRIGGHFVTLAGVSTTQPSICISDPFYDNLEPNHSPYEHFDAANISGPHGQNQHDAYIVAPAALASLPAIAEALADYPNSEAYGNFYRQNEVEDASPCVGQGGPIKTVLEWALVICGTKPFCCVIPGDADGGGDVNIGDASFLVRYIFEMGSPAPACLDEADADGFSSVDIGDAIYIVKYVFQGGETPLCGTTGT